MANSSATTASPAWFHPNRVRKNNRNLSADPDRGRDLGFEIYLECFDGGQMAGLPRTSVRLLFPIVESESEPNYWSVRYDKENSCKVSLTPAASDQDSLVRLCVNRPCGDLRLWRAILRIMELGNVVALFPGCPAPLIAHERVTDHIPARVIEALGSPFRVSSAEELLHLVQHS